MDPHQSTSKRGPCDGKENVPEAHDHTYCKAARDGVQTKRTKSNPLELKLIPSWYNSIPWALRDEKDPVKKNAMMERFKASLTKNSNQAAIVPNISVHDELDVQLWKSVRLVENQVTSIQINLSEVKETTWLTRFLNLLPNLKHLDIRDFEFEEFEDHDLLFIDRRINLMKVLTSVMSKAKKDRDPLIIEGIILPVKKKAHLSIFEKFSNCSNIKIEELKMVLDAGVFTGVPQFETRVLNSVGKLLSASQDILKTLFFPCCELYLSLLDFPPMAKLTNLKLQFSSKTSGPLRRCDFLPSFRFSEKLPNLKDVTIELKMMEQRPNVDFFENLFKSTGTAPTVKNLKYSAMSLDASIASILQAFPNVEELEVKETQCSKNMFYSLWKHGQRLKKLKISFYLGEFLGNLADLDSIFTGFAPEVVEWINKAPKGVFWGFENSETSRVNPSILMLIGLEHLTIDVRGKAGNGERFLPERMLAFAGKWAFSLMARKATILIHMKDCPPGLERAEEVLQEVSRLPNVEIYLDGSDCSC